MYAYPCDFKPVEKFEFWYEDGKFLFSIWCDAIKESYTKEKYYIMNNGVTISILYKSDCETIEFIPDKRYGTYCKVVLKK